MLHEEVRESGMKHFDMLNSLGWTDYRRKNFEI